MAPPKYKPPTVRPPPTQVLRPEPATTPVTQPRSPTSGGFWAIIGILVVGILATRRCSTTSNSTATSQSASSEAAQQAITTAITAQTPPPVEKLSKASLRSGAATFKIAAKAEGLGGEMIYSQNCYDALSRHFSWAKLDACGAFDATAVRELGDSEDAALVKEITWFDSETASGRYLKAATAAGEEAAAAEERLSNLQAGIGGTVKEALASQPSADNLESGSVVTNDLSESTDLPEEASNPSI